MNRRWEEAKSPAGLLSCPRTRWRVAAETVRPFSGVGRRAIIFDGSSAEMIVKSLAAAAKLWPRFEKLVDGKWTMKAFLFLTKKRILLNGWSCGSSFTTSENKSCLRAFIFYLAVFRLGSTGVAVFMLKSVALVGGGLPIIPKNPGGGNWRF
jgi:hypothetical protein